MLFIQTKHYMCEQQKWKFWKKKKKKNELIQCSLESEIKLSNEFISIL